MELIALATGIVGTVVALLTLILVVFRGALNSEGRITALETKMDLFWNAARGIVADSLQGNAPQNPVSEEQWSYLPDKFRSDTLTPAEVQELHAAFLEKNKRKRIRTMRLYSPSA